MSKSGPSQEYSNGAVAIYLKQIGNMRRLTKEEELELWKHFDEIKKIKEDLSKNSPNYDEEVNKIELEIETIQNKLVKSNLRLVVSIAKRYYNSGIPFIDIIDEGNIGLIEAVRRFDYVKGYKFSTYAVWWIRQRIIKIISIKNNAITLPIYISRIIRNSVQVSRKLNQTLGREPNYNEIADEMKIDRRTFASIMVFSQEISSIDGFFTDSNSNSNEIISFIEDKTTVSPHHELINSNLKSIINEALKHLDEKERTVLIARFGLDGSASKTLKETGEQLDLTRERVRQIQIKALKKIRELNLSDELKSFLWD